MGGGSFKVTCPPGAEEINQFVYKHSDCGGLNLTKKKLKWEFFEGGCSRKEKMYPALKLHDYPSCKKGLPMDQDEASVRLSKKNNVLHDEAEEEDQEDEAVDDEVEDADDSVEGSLNRRVDENAGKKAHTRSNDAEDEAEKVEENADDEQGEEQGETDNAGQEEMEEEEGGITAEDDTSTAAEEEEVDGK